MRAMARKFSVVLLFAALLTGVGCNSTDSPTGPTAAATDEPSPLLSNLLGKLRLLSCSTQPYAVTTKAVGPKGGIILVGSHRLSIPAGALATRVTITAEQVAGSTNSVRFAPEGLRFAKPASLTMSYANCSGLLAPKRIVYLNELLRILELLPSLDDAASKSVTAGIRHFSRYAVAW